jgi:D-glycero-D-manno-heptose 1,7-bisphosphate phosphatase
MLLSAAQKYEILLSASWMVGDRWRDVDCGHRAGVRTVFIDLGHAESLRSAPEFTVPSFAMAVAVVLREAQSATRPARVPH